MIVYLVLYVTSKKEADLDDISCFNILRSFLYINIVYYIYQNVYAIYIRG